MTREELKIEIENELTEQGGYTKDSLAKFGVSWPPPKGWKERLLDEAPEAEVSE